MANDWHPFFGYDRGEKKVEDRFDNDVTGCLCVSGAVIRTYACQTCGAIVTERDRDRHNDYHNEKEE